MEYQVNLIVGSMSSGYVFKFTTRAEAEELYNKFVKDISTKKFIEFNYGYYNENGLITVNSDHVIKVSVSDGSGV